MSNKKLLFFKRPGGGLDPDAQAFITAAIITDGTQISAINQLVLDLKTYGLWTKMKAIYPIVGGTAFTHKFNLKDARDLDAAYRLTFSGTFTHSANGVLGNGTGHIETHLNARTVLILNNTHISNYCRINTAGNFVDMYASDGVNHYGLYQRFSNVYYSDCYNGGANRNSIANTDSIGFYSTSRTSSTLLKMYKGNSTLVTSTTAQTSLLPNSQFYLMALDASQYRSDREYAFFTIGDGLNDTEQSNLYNSIQTFQTTLSRQI